MSSPCETSNDVSQGELGEIGKLQTWWIRELGVSLASRFRFRSEVHFNKPRYPVQDDDADDGPVVRRKGGRLFEPCRVEQENIFRCLWPSPIKQLNSSYPTPRPDPTPRPNPTPRPDPTPQLSHFTQQHILVFSFKNTSYWVL